MPVSCAFIITIAWDSLKSIINIAEQLPVCVDNVASLKARTENTLCVYSCHIERFEIEVQVAKCRFGIKNVAGCTEVNL